MDYDRLEIFFSVVHYWCGVVSSSSKGLWIGLHVRPSWRKTCYISCRMDAEENSVSGSQFD